MGLCGVWGCLHCEDLLILSFSYWCPIQPTSWYSVSCCDCRCCCYPGTVPYWPLQINRMVQCDPRSALHTPAVCNVAWRKQVPLWKCPPKVWVYTTRNIQLEKDSDCQQSGGDLDILETLTRGNLNMINFVLDTYVHIWMDNISWY